MDRSERFAGEVHLSSGRGEAAGGLEGDGTHLHLDKPRIAGEAALDGIYVMRTSAPPERLSDLERALRSLKTIDLKDRAAKQTRDPVAPAKRSAAALRTVHTKILDDGTPAGLSGTSAAHRARGLTRRPSRSSRRRPPPSNAPTTC